MKVLSKLRIEINFLKLIKKKRKKTTRNLPAKACNGDKLKAFPIKIRNKIRRTLISTFHCTGVLPNTIR